MDANRTRAEGMWGDIDQFWELVYNHNVFTTAWQAMHANAEYLYWFKEAYGNLIVPLMPNEKNIANVIWRIDGDASSLIADNEEVDASEFIQIPVLCPNMSEDIRYIEGEHFTIVSGGVNSVLLDWGTTDVLGVSTFYAPTVMIQNDNIEKYGNTGVWDINLGGIDIGDKKHILYALEKAKYSTPNRSMFYRCINMLAGAPYARYPGRVHVKANSVLVYYVNKLYTVRYQNRYYGSETRTEAAVEITNKIGTSTTSIKTGDIIVLNSENTVRCAVVREDSQTILFSGAVVDGVYNDAIVFSPVDMDLMECYALYQGHAYSCYTDELRNDILYDITHALNYDSLYGVAEQSSEYQLTSIPLMVEDGEYIDMHAPLWELANMLMWVDHGASGINMDMPIGDDIITNYYMQGSEITYYSDLSNIGDELPGICVGDVLVAYVSYPMKCGTISMEENNKIRLSVGTFIVDMYGEEIPADILNFQVGETVVISDLDNEIFEEVIIAGGYYDGMEEQYVLTTTMAIKMTNPWFLSKVTSVTHRHVVVKIEGTDYFTDRTITYGVYSPDCRATFKRSKTRPEDVRPYICETVTPGLSSSTISVIGGVNGYGNISPRTTKIAVYGENINVVYYDVLSITDVFEIDEVIDEETALKMVGARVLFLNNLCERNIISIKSNNVEASYIKNLKIISQKLLPEGTNVLYNHSLLEHIGE